MKLTDFIPKKAIIHTLKAKDKRDAIVELVQSAKKGAEGEKFGVAEIAEAVFAREKMGTTGVGGGVGIPHAKLDGVKGVIGAFGRSEAGIDFNAVDRDRVHLLFLILSPPTKAEAYQKALQKVLQALKSPNFCKFLRNAKSVKAIDEIFREVEEVASV